MPYYENTCNYSTLILQYGYRAVLMWIWMINIEFSSLRLVSWQIWTHLFGNSRWETSEKQETVSICSTEILWVLLMVIKSSYKKQEAYFHFIKYLIYEVHKISSGDFFKFPRGNKTIIRKYSLIINTWGQIQMIESHRNAETLQKHSFAKWELDISVQSKDEDVVFSAIFTCVYVFLFIYVYVWCQEWGWRYKIAPWSSSLLSTRASWLRSWYEFWNNNDIR